MYGTGEPATIDTDTFSEISLDQTPDLDNYPPPPALYSPLQDTFPTTQSGISASLSQLPLVASTVFSSFSNILKGNSPVPQNQETQPLSVETSTFSQATPQQQQPFYDYPPPPAPIINQEPVEPPKLYSPNDASFLPPAPHLASSGALNAYRLSAKKKIYAPAPGLGSASGQHYQPTHHCETPGPALQNIPPIVPNSSPAVEYLPPSQFPSQPQELKSTSTLSSISSSITSLFATPILEQLLPKGNSNQTTPSVEQNVYDQFTVASSDLSSPQVERKQSSTSLINPTLFNTKPIGQVTAQPTPSLQYPAAQAQAPPQPITHQVDVSSPQSTPPVSFFNPNQFESTNQLFNQPPTSSIQQSNTINQKSQSFFDNSQIADIPAALSRCVYPLSAQLQQPTAPPSLIAPPPGNQSSSYRLKGKPHYKAPSIIPVTPAQSIIEKTVLPVGSTSTQNFFNPIPSEPVPSQPTFSNPAPVESHLPPINFINPTNLPHIPTDLAIRKTSNPVQLPPPPVPVLFTNQSPINFFDNAVVAQNKHQFTQQSFQPSSNLVNPNLQSVQPLNTALFFDSQATQQHSAPTPAEIFKPFQIESTETDQAKNFVVPFSNINLTESSPIEKQSFVSQPNQESAAVIEPKSEIPAEIPTSSNWFNQNPSVGEVRPNSNKDVNLNDVQPHIVSPVNFFNNNNNNIQQQQFPIQANDNQANQDLANYFQIQNFFNNPPLLSDVPEGEQDRNFNIIENSLINKRLHNISKVIGQADNIDSGSISSNLVEPPSSVPSEFSEYADLSIRSDDNNLNKNQVS